MALPDADLLRAATIARLCCEAKASSLISFYLDSDLGPEGVAVEMRRLIGIQAAVDDAAKVNLYIDPAIAMQLFQRGLSVAEAQAALAALPVLPRTAPAANGKVETSWDRAIRRAVEKQNGQ